jgi:diaminopimelate epimerase
MPSIAFAKLHGAGNDFVLIDETTLDSQLQLDYRKLAARLGDRHRGAGFDQLMVVTRAERTWGYLIYNADGTAAQQCGNGARAVAWWLSHRHSLKAPFVMHSPAGDVQVSTSDTGLIGVNLGKPRFEPKMIPLARPNLSLRYQTKAGETPIEFFTVGLGNPHAVILVEDLQKAAVDAIGAALQRHPDFPERVNVGFCQVLSKRAIKLRVYERGVGETLACGSGACAAAISMMRAGLCERTVSVELPGGMLEVDWPNDSAHVTLRGPVVHVFDAELPLLTNEYQRKDMRRKTA